MSEKATEPKRDYFQEVTNELIAVMEKGELPWQKPWDDKVGGNLCPKPFNGKSGRAYTVENAVRLLIKMQEKNSNDPRYFTFVQAQEKEWSIKPGAKATCVRQGFYVTKDRFGNDLPEEEHHWTNKYINVFHASDICKEIVFAKDEKGKIIYEDVLDADGNPVMVDDLDKNGKPKGYELALDEDGNMIIGANNQPVRIPRQKVKRLPKIISITPIPEFTPNTTSCYTHEETMELAEAVLQNSGAKISHTSADRAFYNKDSDTIYMPPKEAFPSLSGYYATALHELAHWTGHENRLNRVLNGNKQSLSYAKEELRAELASVFLSMELGVPVNTTQNAAYLQSWVQNMKDDKQEIFKASNDAMKITNFIKDLAKEKIKEITMNKTGKKEEPEIEIVNEPKQETVQEPPTKETLQTGTVLEPQSKSQEEKDNEILKQNGIDVIEPRDLPVAEKPTKETPTITVTKAKIIPTREGVVTEEISKTEIPVTSEPEPQPQPEPSCLIVSVYNPKDGEFGKEFNFESKGKFKLSDFERQPPDIIVDASSPQEYFAKHKDHPVGSMVQVDDELFYMNKDNKFRKVYGAYVNGDVVVMPAANQEKLKEFEGKIVEKVGQEKFDDYKESFMEMFRNGAAVENLTPSTDNLDLAYSKFVYDNAVKFGLSSSNPIAAKQWDNANNYFMKTCVKEFGADSAMVNLAAKAVKDICPVNVDAEALKAVTVKSSTYQQHKAEESKNVQIAAYGVR